MSSPDNTADTVRERLLALFRDGHRPAEVRRMTGVAMSWIKVVWKQFQVGIVDVKPYRCKECGFKVCTVPCLVCRAENHGEAQCSG